MIPITNAENFDRQATRAAAMLSRKANLLEIPLAAGDFPGFAIDVPNGTGLPLLRSSDWIGKKDPAGRPYEGVRIVGQGMDRTHLRGNFYGWTLDVAQHAGIVQLENLTLHGWSSWGAATLFGSENTYARKLEPKFMKRLIGCRVLVDPPKDGVRGKWGLFANQADEYLKDCILNSIEAREHADYQHGVAQWGSFWDNVLVEGSGAENDKNRPDARETVWAGRNVWLIRKNCVCQNWYQIHSNWGGGGTISQNMAANVLIEDGTYLGGRPLGTIPANLRSHAIMLSSEGNAYDILTGAVGSGFGHGLVALRRVDAFGHSDFPWQNELVSIYSNGGGKPARAVLIEDCGLYGKGVIVKLSGIPNGQTLVRGCNSPLVRERASRKGIDTSVEATLNGLPVSAGLVA